MTAERNGVRTWIEVDRKAIRHNFHVFKKFIPRRTKLMAVVKSNAYGHGLIDFSCEMEKLGADFLGVDSMVEARALRREGVKLPILVLGYTMPELFEEAIRDTISLTVSSLNIVRYIELQQKHFSHPLKVHIKVDTGMHRQGFLPKDLPRVLSSLLRISARGGSALGGKDKGLKIETSGLYTHFANAKNPAFPTDTKEQLAEFRKWIVAFRKAGLRPIVHAAATAGVLLFPESHFDMVRIGIGLYGLWPAPEIREFLKDTITLKPALVWKSFVTEIKTLPKGSRIGYDLTEMLPKKTTVGVVPIGYWHGYPRSLSSIGRVLVRGRACKVLGRVSMDMISIDTTAVRGVRAGDEVTVMGGDEASPVSAAGLAHSLDTSWYEIITRLNPLIKRIYVN